MSCGATVTRALRFCHGLPRFAPQGGRCAIVDGERAAPPGRAASAEGAPSMNIHTISAYETSAERFFGRLEAWEADLVLDARLKNTNQLAGFTKRDDLAFFVDRIAHARYVHDKLFAPAPTMLERYLHGNIDWDAYADSYRRDLRERDAVALFFERYGGRALRRFSLRGPRGHRDALPPLARRSAQADARGRSRRVGAMRRGRPLWPCARRRARRRGSGARRWRRPCNLRLWHRAPRSARAGKRASRRP